MVQPLLVAAVIRRGPVSPQPLAVEEAAPLLLPALMLLMFNQAKPPSIVFTGTANYLRRALGS